MKTYTDYLAIFFVTWILVIILNQVFFFSACFKFYCIKNALPHTAVISAIITFLIYKLKNKYPIHTNFYLNHLYNDVYLKLIK